MTVNSLNCIIFLIISIEFLRTKPNPSCLKTVNEMDVKNKYIRNTLHEIRNILKNIAGLETGFELLTILDVI